MKKSILCTLGFHKWSGWTERTVTLPKKGRDDKRSEKERTVRVVQRHCHRCGEKVYA